MARLYTRFGILKHAGVEEYLISFSMAASSGFLVVVMFRKYIRRVKGKLATLSG